MNLESTLTILLGIISLVTAVLGAIAWYRGSVVKDYAASRDFNHLKRSYEQLATNQAEILKELDTRCDALDRQLLRIESLLIARNLP